jgi:hypothetical protein
VLGAVGLLFVFVPADDRRAFLHPTATLLFNPVGGALFLGIGVWQLLRARALNRSARECLLNGRAVIGRVTEAALKVYGRGREAVYLTARYEEGNDVWEVKGAWGDQLGINVRDFGKGSEVVLLLDPTRPGHAALLPYDYPEVREWRLPGGA